MNKTQERVLGLRVERLKQAGLVHGFRSFDARLFAFLLDPAHLEFRPRGAAEEDPSFKQLIPYVVLRHRGTLFHYTRGKSGTEARLRALRSVGVGGHISADEDAAAADPYRAGMLRELREEIDIASPYRETMLGLINDDSTPVGRVHLGVAHLFELESPAATPRESAIAAAGFAPLSELRTRSGEFETWSQLVLDVLSGPLGRS